MRSTIVPVLAVALFAGGCDRQSPSAAQGDGADAGAATGVSADEVRPAGRQTPAAGGFDRTHRGEAAPAHPFTDLSGKAATLADFRGKPTLVNLWATWCTPCVRELPTLEALAVREGGRLNVVALSQDMTPGKVAPFVAARGFRALKVRIDPGMAWVPAITATLPTTILYDAAGREVWRVAGDLDWAGDAAKKAIAEAR